MSEKWRDPAVVEGRIRDRVVVDRQLLVLAKAHLTTNCLGEVARQADAFVASLGVQPPNPLVIHPSVDVEAGITAVAKSLSAKVALGEAVWALIASGVMVPRSGGNTAPRMGLAWTTMIPGSGGSRSSWRFDDLAVHMPSEFGLAPSWVGPAGHLS